MSAPSTVVVDLGLSWMAGRMPQPRVINVVPPPTASRLSDAVIIVDVQCIFVRLVDVLVAASRFAVI